MKKRISKPKKILGTAKKPKAKPTKKAAPKTVHRNAEKILYTYVDKTNRTYAMQNGKKRYGSASEYVNHLIARDRKVHGRRGTSTKAAA